MCETFDSAEAQYAALADAIWTNIHEDELDATDILIVLPSAYTSRKTGASVMAALATRKINAHLVGVTTSRDELFFPDSVAVTHIFRAKGNEAPMVYIVNAEFCQVGFELSRKRNILFTGITRSRCWVRLFGVGPLMTELKEEVEEVRKRQFDLEFKYPTEEELKQMARVHRDMTDEERKHWERKINDAGELFRAVIDGDLPIEALPPELQKSLVAITRRSVEAKDTKAKK
jgi:superfamily I DNA and RNA helicase